MASIVQQLGGTQTSCSYHANLVEQAFGARPARHSPHRALSDNRSSCRYKIQGLQTARQCRAARLTVFAADGAWNPPTVAETKAKFYNGYKKPVSAVYNTVLQEFLVQQHLIRYNKNYKYDEIFALGFVSVFDQVLEGVPDSSDQIFTAYLQSLDEDPSKYRSDADRLAEWAKGLSSFADIKPDSDGDDIQKSLADVAERSKDGKFLYSKFFAIGLFRLLELTGAKDPQALGNLVKSMHVRQEAVNRDLLTYKGVLSKLSAAKELMREFIEREKRKQAEREAEKKERAAASQTQETAVASDAEGQKAQA